MDPLQAAFSAVRGVAKAVEKSDSNQEDCKLLASLAERTLPFLRQLEQLPIGNDPLLIRSLDVVTSALQDAETVAEKCCESTYFVRLIRATEYHEMLKGTTQRLEFALQQLPLATMGMTTEMNETLSLLMEDMKKAKFEQTAMNVRQTRALQEQLERARLSDQESREEIRDMIREMLEKHSSLEERLGDMRSLKDLMEGARKNKSEQNEFELQQIMDVIVESMQASASSDNALDLHSYLHCPITKDIMVDPVILKDSCITYERSAIEGHIARMYRRDPVTQIEISSGELIPNLAMRAASHAVLEAQGMDIAALSAGLSARGDCPELEPGIYEGRGKQLKQNGDTIYLFVMVILEPDGNVEGSVWWESNDRTMHASRIHKGKWIKEDNGFTFASTQSVFKGKFQIEVKRLSKSATFDVKGKAFPIITLLNVDEEFLPILYTWSEPDEVDLQHLAPCNLQSHYLIHPGLLECEGAVIASDNTKYRNKLALLLEVDWSLRGWIYVKTKDVGDVFTSHVTGSWDNSGNVSLIADFQISSNVSLDAPASPSSPSSLLVTYKMFGDLINEAREESLGRVVFSGACKRVTQSRKQDEQCPFPGVTENRFGSFEYTNIRTPSRSLSFSDRSLLRLCRIPHERGMLKATLMAGGLGGGLASCVVSSNVYLTKIEATHGTYLQTIQLTFANGRIEKFGGGGNPAWRDGPEKTSCEFDFASGERVTNIEFYARRFSRGIRLTTTLHQHVSIGPLTGQRCNTVDFKDHPVTLHGVAVRHGGCIDAIAFVYKEW